jgi:outer membrane lipoprotein-sorting protein
MNRIALALAVAVAVIPSAAVAQEAPVVVEARAFMEAYARDLAAGDRAALADRYDRQGATVIFNGHRMVQTHAQIVAGYRDQWAPPKTFRWSDLTYEAAGPDAVVVNGGFVWGVDASEQPFAYSAFLRRQDGRLRIRLEHETAKLNRAQ